MVDKVDITDPYKVDPSLKGKPKKQLEMERDLRNMAIDILEKEEKRAEMEGVVTQANDHIAAIVAGLSYLNGYNLLSDEAKQFYSSGTGAFMPHLRFKPITADRVLARMGDAPAKRTRRKKAS